MSSFYDTVCLFLLYNIKRVKYILNLSSWAHSFLYRVNKQLSWIEPRQGSRIIKSGLKLLLWPPSCLFIIQPSLRKDLKTKELRATVSGCPFFSLFSGLSRTTEITEPWSSYVEGDLKLILEIEICTSSFSP